MVDREVSGSLLAYGWQDKTDMYTNYMHEDKKIFFSDFIISAK